MNWIKVTDKPFPEEQPGTYLVWLNEKLLGSYAHSYIVKKISNGYVGLITGAFATDIVGNKDPYSCGMKIVAWAEIPMWQRARFIADADGYPTKGLECYVIVGKPSYISGNSPIYGGKCHTSEAVTINVYGESGSLLSCSIKILELLPEFKEEVNISPSIHSLR